MAADEGLSALPEATGRISWKTGAAEPRPYLRPPCGGPVDEGRRPYQRQEAGTVAAVASADLDLLSAPRARNCQVGDIHPKAIFF